MNGRTKVRTSRSRRSVWPSQRGERRGKAEQNKTRMNGRTKVRTSRSRRASSSSTAAILAGVRRGVVKNPISVHAHVVHPSRCRAAARGERERRPVGLAWGAALCYTASVWRGGGKRSQYAAAAAGPRGLAGLLAARRLHTCVSALPARASSSLLAGRFVRSLSPSCAFDSIGTRAESALLASDGTRA
uniref:Uncharacterized protein n=1 Tax=Plectus sambesii TaxID=2011161 RepID=A0A914XEG3_9BILA